MAIRFSSFTPATRRETPEFMEAVIAQAAADNAEKARVQSLKAQNTLGGLYLYNQAMGDRTPIADALSKWGGSSALPAAEAAPVAESMVTNAAGAGGASAGTAAIPGLEALGGAAATGTATTGAGAAGGAGASGIAAAAPWLVAALALYGMMK